LNQESNTTVHRERERERERERDPPYMRITYDADDEEGGIHGSWLIGRQRGNHATGSKGKLAKWWIQPSRR
jgi:hypothetical protein